MLELYSTNSSNGQRASVVLAESGLPHVVHKVNMSLGAKKLPEALQNGPSTDVPALVDPEGAPGAGLVLWQSGAIALYVAEKAPHLLAKEGPERAHAIQWTVQSVADVAAASYSHYYLVGNTTQDVGQRLADWFEARLVGYFKSCDAQLSSSKYLAGKNPTVADFALFPVVAFRDRIIQKAGELSHLRRWADEIGARPAVQKGMAVAGFPHEPEWGERLPGKGSR